MIESPYLGQVLLFRGRGLISTLIRWQTRGYYSHAAIRVSENECIEAWQGAGVRMKRITDWAGIDIFDVDATPRQKIIAANYAAQQIGKGYDYLGVLRFVSRRQRNNPERFFCSELVAAAFEHAGSFLLRAEPWRISPSGLATSPLLSGPYVRVGRSTARVNWARK